MADINKLRELGKSRHIKQDKYYEEIIEKIEETMLEVAPYDDNVVVIFMRSSYAYGSSNSGPSKCIYVETDKFDHFGKYLYKIQKKYEKEDFTTSIEDNGYQLYISWEE